MGSSASSQSPAVLRYEFFSDSIADLAGRVGANDATRVNVKYHTVSGDGGGGQFRWASGEAPGTFVDNGGTIILPSGGDGSAAWIREGLDVVGVSLFGAVGDGADETSLIQAAVNTGVSVRFETGKTYVLSENISLKSNTVIDLNGCTISGAGFEISNKTNVRIKDGKITGSGASFDYSVHIFNGSTNVTLDNILCEEVDNGFYISGTDAAVSNIVTNNCRVVNSKSIACYHYNANKIFHSNFSVFNAVWGMNIVSGCSDIQVDGISVILGAASTTPTGDDTYYSGGAPEHGLYFHNCNDIIISNLVSRGWNRIAGNCGVKLRNLDGVKIAGGIISDCNNPFGLFIQSGSDFYLRRCEIENVRLETCASTIFINDYVGAGGGSLEINIKFSNCYIGHGGNINASCEDVASVLVFQGCTFPDRVYVQGTWEGFKHFKNCVFETSATYNIGFLSTFYGEMTTIEDCTFLDWNTDGLVPSSSSQYGSASAIKLDNGCQKIRIKDCVFCQNEKLRIGAYGSVAGQLSKILVSGCVGGGGVFFFQSGGSDTIYMANCVNYSDSIAGATVTMNSAGNNTKLNDDGTVTAY